jgi:hypothetical protein
MATPCHTSMEEGKGGEVQGMEKEGAAIRGMMRKERKEDEGIWERREDSRQDLGRDLGRDSGRDSGQDSGGTSQNEGKLR